MMRGLELSRRYFEAVGKPLIRSRFSEYEPRIAAGLVGHGSECLGFDDLISTDHDYGPSFCLWLSQQDYLDIGKKLQAAYDALPGDFLGVPKRVASPYSSQRVGVFSISSFYQMFVGPYLPPKNDIEWLLIPEENLSAATNGTVFCDNLGEFTSVREALLAYYPRDVWLKKISVRLCVMAQSGQYNYNRCIKRGDVVAARLAVDEFLRATIRVMHLINRKYTPFYKWSYQHMNLLVLPPELPPLLKQLALQEIPRTSPIGDAFSSSLEISDENSIIIDQICMLVIKELHRLGLSGSNSDFLLDHGVEIAGLIYNPDIQRMGLMEG